MDVLTRKRQMVAEFGLPVEMADMLTGETDGEIRDSATRLAAGLEKAKAQQQASTSAPAAPSFGASGSAERPW